jgi:hypothetical protein
MIQFVKPQTENIMKKKIEVLKHQIMLKKQVLLRWEGRLHVFKRILNTDCFEDMVTGSDCLEARCVHCGLFAIGGYTCNREEMTEKEFKEYGCYRKNFEDVEADNQEGKFEDWLE